MNDYEQMKNLFLVQLQELNPGMMPDEYNVITKALDLAVTNYDISKKKTDVIPYVEPIPMLVKTYLVVKKTEGLAKGTLENYARILIKFFSWIRKPPEEITANDIRLFIYNYQRFRHVSDRTLDKYRETICWFFTWAHMEEYLPRNPGRSIKPIKYEIKERQALSQIELEYLRMACETVRDRAMLEFMYSTGCRVTELANVKKADIDWHEKTVHLFGKGRKHRTSYINAKCEVTLKEYLKQRNDECEYLFVTLRKPYRKMTKCAIEKVMRLMSERSRVDKHVCPHIIRHTTATQALNHGMPLEDVSKLLGHSSVDTTLIYAKTARSKVQAEHIRCVV